MPTALADFDEKLRWDLLFFEIMDGAEPVGIFNAGISYIRPLEFSPVLHCVWNPFARRAAVQAQHVTTNLRATLRPPITYYLLLTITSYLLLSITSLLLPITYYLLLRLITYYLLSIVRYLLPITYCRL